MCLWHGICQTNSAIPTQGTVYGHQHWIPEAESQKPEMKAGSQNPEEEACSQNPEEEACSRKPEEKACSRKPEVKTRSGSRKPDAGHPESIIKKNYKNYEQRKKVFNP